MKNWRKKFARLATRMQYSVNANIKLNPHEPMGVVKDLISNEHPTFPGEKNEIVRYVC